MALERKTPDDGMGSIERGARLLRLSEVADRLALSRSMCWKLVATGELPSIRIGRACRVRPSDLEAFVADPAER